MIFVLGTTLLFGKNERKNKVYFCVKCHMAITQK